MNQNKPKPNLRDIANIDVIRKYLTARATNDMSNLDMAVMYKEDEEDKYNIDYERSRKIASRSPFSGFGWYGIKSLKGIFKGAANRPNTDKKTEVMNTFIEILLEPHFQDRERRIFLSVKYAAEALGVTMIEFINQLREYISDMHTKTLMNQDDEEMKQVKAVYAVGQLLSMIPMVYDQNNILIPFTKMTRVNVNEVPDTEHAQFDKLGKATLDAYHKGVEDCRKIYVTEGGKRKRTTKRKSQRKRTAKKKRSTKRRTQRKPSTKRH